MYLKATKHVSELSDLNLLYRKMKNYFPYLIFKTLVSEVSILVLQLGYE